MKITISHDQSTIDPSGNYTKEKFEDVRYALEEEYEAAIKAEYPDGEVVFGNDTTYSVLVSEADMDDPGDVEFDVQSICERVFEDGNFWV